MRGWKHNEEYEQNLLAFIHFGLSGVLQRFEVLTMDVGGKVHKDLQHLGIQLGSWVGHTRAGNLNTGDIGEQKHIGTPKHECAVACNFTNFYDQNVILPNGDVVLCCMDYSLKHKIGNLLEQDYYEMFASGSISKIMAENMQRRFSENSLCRTCDRAKPLDVGASHQFWEHAA